jgi:protein-S-isoprenylcysteine O-methyltransferase Ste14
MIDVDKAAPGMRIWHGEVNRMTAERGRELNSRAGRVFAVLGTAVFLLLAPGTVAGLVPWWISRWRVQPPFLGFAPFRIIGVLLIIAGIPVLLESFGRFALQGIGTPAPVFPTRYLVVKGFYRYVRNPMYASVVSILVGQALLLGDFRILVWAMFAWAVAHLFVLTYEEPTLRKSFGAEYEVFCAHVPRWIPRLTPGLGGAD